MQSEIKYICIWKAISNLQDSPERLVKCCPFAASHYSCYWETRTGSLRIPGFLVSGYCHYSSDGEWSIRILDPKKDAVAKNAVKSCLHPVEKVINKG